MNLNPVTYEEFIVKKENLEKKKTKSSKVSAPDSNKKAAESYISNYCEICCKSFGSANKLTEHLNSKSHKNKKEGKAKEQTKSTPIDGTTTTGDQPSTTSTSNEQKKKVTQTAQNNFLICFVCNNNESTTVRQLLDHLKDSHFFEFPVASQLKKPEHAVKLCVKKIFVYGACLYCDSQKFPNSKAIQTHMRDTGHIKINFEDIIERFYKYYSKKTILEATDSEKKSKEYKVLKRILLPKKKTKKEEDEIEEVEEIDENEVVEEVVEEVVDTKKENEIPTAYENLSDVSVDEEDLEDINYVELDNGEIMLRNGTVLGSRLYKNIYKQRVKLDMESWKKSSQTSLMRIKSRSHQRQLNKMQNKKGQFSHWNITGSKKSLFTRINTLRKVRKQVNC
eukprot:CAMPEP_0170537090 /NCGR_PEP_ID=MMETSP0209-20121228/102516_1 /TAXON_ID=665100 ORGANISM="Litonotus pictus, Strain P1" /NCGR_SAMPLE_ID=MMETSP0209 /ASSEMBLY_ACC=CAM_ASM_000301 /LENGTH=392 /DNA_ID=CAMNT_0010838539 /DNA_START=127 /DNA_END=1305 /DNA_ORIENTATION=+